MKKEVLMDQSYVEIFLDKETNIIVAKWIGFLKIDQVKAGCSFLTSYVRTNRIKGHLSDHRGLKVLSAEVQDYLTKTWFAEVEGVGLRRVGAIVSDDVFAKATVDRVNTLAKVGNLQILMFSSEKDCIEWLKQA